MSLIWVLKGARLGDTNQALELAARLEGDVVEIPLRFSALHVLPNFLGGAHLHGITRESKGLLQSPWPDLVIATGKRTAPVSCWIKRQSKGVTRNVHLGRPRMAQSLFDLVVTTRQYGLPAADNVVELSTPFAKPKQLVETEVAHFEKLWEHLPRPWVLAVIGGGKYPVRLGYEELGKFGTCVNRHAETFGGSVILLDSPRSDEGALQRVQEMLRVPHWSVKRGEGLNPYQAALQLADRFSVTSDSVSMLSEMLSTGRSVQVFRLPLSPLAVNWRATRGLTAVLARRGLISPPRDVDGFVQWLLNDGYVGDLAAQTLPTKILDSRAQHDSVVQRIIKIMKP